MILTAQLTKKLKRQIYKAGKEGLIRNHPGAQALHGRRRMGSQGRPIELYSHISIISSSFIYF